MRNFTNVHFSFVELIGLGLGLSELDYITASGSQVAQIEDPSELVASYEISRLMNDEY